MLPDGSYGGNPGGFLLSITGSKLYFACDTALFYDMKLIGEQGIDVAVLPIGDQFTMGPADSIAPRNCSSRGSSCRRTTTPGRRSIRMPTPGPRKYAARPGPSRACSLLAARLSLTPRKVRPRRGHVHGALRNPRQTWPNCVVRGAAANRACARNVAATARGGSIVYNSVA